MAKLIDNQYMNTVNYYRHGNSWIHLPIIFLITFIVYCWSAPRTVVLEDDGLFIMAAYFNGIAHPPGYPLYTLLAHVSTWLPFGSVAFRVHLLSGLFAALACVSVWVIAFRLFRDRIPAYAAALSFGFSMTFWSQAIISEVYTLNVLLVSIIFINCLLLIEDSNNQNFRRKLKLLFFLYGLALTNHWPLLVLSTPMFIALLWPRLTSILRLSITSMPYLIIGLMPYLWMVIRSNMNPEISFYGPIENWHDFWFYVSRQGYKEIDISPSVGWIDRLYLISYSLADTARQFGVVGFVFILSGMIYQFRMLKKNIILALFLGYLGSTVVLICLLGFDYDLYNRIVFRVYPLIAWFCTSIWLGMGVISISKLCISLGRGRIDNKITVLGFTMLVSATTFASNLPENYRSNDYWAHNYARTILDSLPADSVLFLFSDVNVHPVGYLNKVEGHRKDVKLYHSTGQVFKNRIYRPLKTDVNQAKKKIEEFINSTSAPIYYTDKLMHGYGKEYYGLYSKVLKEKHGNFIRTIITPDLQEYWTIIVNNRIPHDSWERIHYKTIVSYGCSLLNWINANADKNIDEQDDLNGLRNNLCNNLQGKYIQLEFEFQKEHPDWNYIHQLIEKAETMLHESRGKSESALLDYYRGEIFTMRGNYQDAVLAYQHSLEIWNHPDNPSYSKITRDMPEP